MYNNLKRLNRKDFNIALSLGKRRKSKNFSLVLSDDVFGYSVVVSKKTARLSVSRNRIKRRVKEIFSKIKTNARCVIIFPRAETKDMEYDALQAELSKLLL